MIAKDDIKDIGSLTPMQEGMLFHHLLAQGAPVYFEQTSYRVHDELDHVLFEQAFIRLVERHDVLRTIILHEKVQRPVQVVLKKRTPSMYYEDISHLTEDEQEKRVSEFKIADRQRGFDLQKNLLIRLSVLKLSRQRCEVIWSFHHVIMDGWCTSILVKEMLIIYTALKQGKTIDLPPAIPYKHYLKWLEKQDKEKGKEFWLEYLAGYETIAAVPSQLAANPAAAANETNAYQPGLYRFSINAALTGKLEQIAKDCTVTFSTLFHALWGILIQKYNNTDDVVFGAVVSGRPPDIQGIDRMIGLFINTVPLRIRTLPQEKLPSLLLQVQKHMVQAKSYEFVPLAEIQAATTLRGGLVNHIIVFENYPTAAEIEKSAAVEGFSVGKIEMFEQTNYDINISAGLRKELGIIVNFNTALYQRSDIERIEAHLLRVIEQLCADPGIPIEALEIVPESEKKHILEVLNDTNRDYPAGSTILQLFDRQVQQTPGSIALVAPARPAREARPARDARDAASARPVTPPEVSLTYRHLHETAQHVAALLSSRGIGNRQPGSGGNRIVGIMLEPCLDMLGGILGIITAGACFLPLDPLFPPARLAYMLRDSQASVLLTLPQVYEDIIPNLNYAGEILSPAVQHELVPGHHPAAAGAVSPAFPLTPDSPLYTIYTSGTTGKSKGVLLTHRNLVNYVSWFQGIAHITPHDRGLVTSSFGFDLCYTSIFPTILGGGRLHLIPRDTYLDPGLLIDYIFTRGITYLKITPSLFSVIADSHNFVLSNLRKLRLLVLGGEAIKVEDVDKVHAVAPALQVMNHYGPTETTIGTIAQFIDFDHFEAYKEYPSIGKPISNNRVYLLDRNGNLRPQGQVGELYIGGAGLAPGYLNQPELSAEKFVICPMTNDKVRLYRTGDLARWSANGYLQFLGRNDGQVKIRGNRIEVREVENVLAKHEDIAQAAVMARDGKDGHKYLAAYIVPNGTTCCGCPIDDNAGIAAKLEEYLALYVPVFMIPSFFVIMEKIPVTANGKIDLALLPEPTALPGSETIAPSTDLEKKLAAIWAEVLGLEPNGVGTRDNFFQAGGHSLNAIVLLPRIHKIFDVRVPLTEFFKNPTIQGLAAYIENTEKSRFMSIEPAEKKEYYPASLNQRRFYILQRMNPGSTSYNSSRVFELRGNLDTTQLTMAFAKVVQRHTGLRTSFEIIDNELVQRIHYDADLDIGFSQGTEYEAQQYSAAFVKPFRLEEAPLLRVGLFSLETDRHLLIIDMHHIITDGLSFVILSQEFVDLYQNKVLAPLKLQYTDFSEWQQRESQRIKKQGEYWLGQFAGGVPQLRLRSDFARPAVQRFEGSYFLMDIAAAETALLDELVVREESTLFIALFTVYNILLWKMTGQEELVVGTGVLNRSHVDLMNIIGLFFNTIPLRNRVSGDQPFRSLLAEVKRRTFEAFENQEYPVDSLVEELTAKGLFTRDASRNPLFDTMFALQNFQDIKESVTGPADGSSLGLSVRKYQQEEKRSRVDLFLMVTRLPHTIRIAFEYSTALFKLSTIQQIAGYFNDILNQVLADNGIKLDDMSLTGHLLEAKSTAGQEEYTDFAF